MFLAEGYEAAIKPPSGHNQSVHLEECPLRSHLSRRPRPYAQGTQSSDGGDIDDESNSGKADNIQVLRRQESGYRRKMQVVIWRKKK